jgi:undecaprenyl-diphosphatase
LDYRIEQWVSGPAGHSVVWDTLMAGVAYWALPALFGIVIVWFVVGWVFGRPEERRGAILALLAAGGAWLIRQVIIRAWVRPRPFVAHPRAVHKLIAHASDPSFPSGHAAASIAIAVAVLLVHRRVGGLVLTVALVISYARVYVGVHYPSDVLAGALIGTGAALVFWRPLAIIPTRVNSAVTSLIRRSRLPLPDRIGGGPYPR